MKNLDPTMSSMENSRFIALFSSLIKEMAVDSNMPLPDINCLVLAYYKFAKIHGHSIKMMKKIQFFTLYLVLFGVSDTQIVERSLFAITKDMTYVSPQSWVKLFELFTTKDINVRMRFAFAVYNTKGTGVIDREQVGAACDNFFTEGDDEEELSELKADMIEFLMKKFDVDQDGVISFEDYSSVVIKQPVLLEFLGWIFPSKYDLQLVAHVFNFDSLLNVLDSS